MKLTAGGGRRVRRKGRILYSLASLVSHSCANNAAYSIHPETLKQEKTIIENKNS